jgi:PhzF family phenazine biosynthesis protein
VALRIPLYWIDAFSDRVFGGNPAAVCPLPRWIDAGILQRIAAENNLSETAFMVRRGDAYDLRWFTPTHEVDLCGHATLAAAYVVLAHLEEGVAEVAFQTRSGTLQVREESGLLRMSFPAYSLRELPDPPAELVRGLGSQPERVLHAVKNYYAVFEDEEEVRGLRPDLAVLAGLHPNGVSVTAPGAACDFVSRYFAPSYGIPEDPVSGHPHCALAPFWAARLGRRRLLARQVSARGGELDCELDGDRVTISGRAVPYLRGEIQVPDSDGLSY